MFNLFRPIPKEEREFKNSGEKCVNCGKPMSRHSRMGFNRCMDTPLRIQITKKGEGYAEKAKGSFFNPFGG
jgi:hypothetical protein